MVLNSAGVGLQCARATTCTTPVADISASLPFTYVCVSHIYISGNGTVLPCCIGCLPVLYVHIIHNHWPIGVITLRPTDKVSDDKKGFTVHCTSSYSWWCSQPQSWRSQETNTHTATAIKITVNKMWSTNKAGEMLYCHRSESFWAYIHSIEASSSVNC